MGRFEDVKERANIKQYCDGNLEPRGGNTYVCPACHSGEGPNRTAAFTIQPDKGRWHCFACSKGGDIFDLAGIINGTEDKREQLSLVAAWFGLEDGERGYEVRSKTTAQATTGKRPDRIIEEHREGRAASRQYIEAMRENITDPEAMAYLQARGFRDEDVKRFGLGYDPKGRRIVIPWAGSDYYHIDRSIDHDGKGKYHKPAYEDVGIQPIWNRAAISGERPYFVVEGAIDALAVQAAGGEAVALGGTGTRAFLEAAAAYKGTTMPILMLDGDEAGRKAQEQLASGLEARGVPYIEGELLARSSASYSVPKDAGELLAESEAVLGDGERMSGRDALAKLVCRFEKRALAEAQARREAAYLKALEHLRVLDPSDVAGDILVLKSPRETIPTGFASLDIQLGGGLPSVGLVTMGAVSSMGKTTLISQAADNMAAAGRLVLFVTIEQAADEIVAKSLSRLMAKRTREDGTGIQASTQSILSGEARSRWYSSDPEKAEALQAACFEYDATIGRNMRIMEGDGRPSVADVRAVAETMAAYDGRAPIVFIDYLQLLAPQDERQTDKQATDANITALRQLARELKTCVFVLSSLNRASYDGAITLSSFKESGMVEYSTDLLLGLQPRGMVAELEGKDEKKQAAEAKRLIGSFKQATDRQAEIVVLKNRNGGVTLEGVPLRYNAITNTFKDGSR